MKTLKLAFISYVLASIFAVNTASAHDIGCKSDFDFKKAIKEKNYFGLIICGSFSIIGYPFKLLDKQDKKNESKRDKKLAKLGILPRPLGTGYNTSIIYDTQPEKITFLVEFDTSSNLEAAKKTCSFNKGHLATPAEMSILSRGAELDKRIRNSMVYLNADSKKHEVFMVGWNDDPTNDIFMSDKSDKVTFASSKALVKKLSSSDRNNYRETFKDEAHILPAVCVIP